MNKIPHFHDPFVSNRHSGRFHVFIAVTGGAITVEMGISVGWKVGSLAAVWPGHKVASFYVLEACTPNFTGDTLSYIPLAGG